MAGRKKSELEKNGQTLESLYVNDGIFCSCTKCGKKFNERDFHRNNNSHLYTFSHALPICKDCLIELFNIYNADYHSQKKAVQRICMFYDIYYSNDIYDRAKDQDGNVSIVSYIAKSNLIQYKNKTFDSTLEEGFRFTGESSAIDIGLSDDRDEYEALKPDPRLVEKWGTGFSTAENYEILEEHYKRLKRNNPGCTNNQELFIISLCHLNLMMKQALQSGNIDDYAKANEQYARTFKNAGLKAVQEVDLNSNDCWGEWVRRIEKYTPAEYYQNKDLYKDYDGIGEYFKRFILRPIKNLMFGSTDRDPEYSVKDGDNEENGS